VTWVHAQVVDSPAHGNMGALERLDDPIGTSTESLIPMKSLVDRYKKTHKARGAHPRMGCIVPRDTTIDGCTSSFRHTISAKGRDDSFGRDGSRRSATHPKDTMIRIGDLWSPYKRTRAQNQGRKEDWSKNKKANLRQSSKARQN
jgi:hypothetical protein